MVNSFMTALFARIGPKTLEGLNYWQEYPLQANIWPLWIILTVIALLALTALRRCCLAWRRLGKPLRHHACARDSKGYTAMVRGVPDISLSICRSPLIKF